MLVGKLKIGSLKGQMVQFTTRLSKGQAYVLQHVAMEENLSISEVMRNVITESVTSGYLGRKFNLEMIAGSGLGPRPRKKKKK